MEVEAAARAGVGARLEQREQPKMPLEALEGERPGQVVLHEHRRHGLKGAQLVERAHHADRSECAEERLVASS